MENVYSNYNNIAEGFGTFLKNAEKQKAGFNAMKRSYLAGIDYVKNIFDEGGEYLLLLQLFHTKYFLNRFPQIQYFEQFDLIIKEMIFCF